MRLEIIDNKIVIVKEEKKLPYTVGKFLLEDNGYTIISDDFCCVFVNTICIFGKLDKSIFNKMKIGDKYIIHDIPSKFQAKKYKKIIEKFNRLFQVSNIYL